MLRRPLAVGAIVVALSLSLSISDARADDDPLWPQLSYSVAVGKSDGAGLGHMWVGAGAHTATGQFVLVGGDFDFRDAGNEAWLVGRIGQGWFKDRALAPMASMYLIGGVRPGARDRAVVRRASGETPTDDVRYRLGAGVSVPAMIQLACIGIPTMLEGGVDLGDAGNSRRYFMRLGWNF